MARTSVRLTTASTSPLWADEAWIPSSTAPALRVGSRGRPMASAIATKIRVLQLRAGIQKPGKFLLGRDNAERAIIEHDYFHRQFELYDAENIAHQHRESAIVGQRDHLTART